MRIKPVVALGLVAGALTIPAPAFALGLGKLTVESPLGQPLSARIELTSASKDELDSLSAKIADPALYKQNNLSYQPVLSRARVTLERAASGGAYLTIVTAGAVSEPYLDLMVELNWASGRVVREYTFLLDPPGVAQQAAVEPVAPVRIGAAPAPAPAATPAAPPVLVAPPAPAPRAPAAVAPAAPATAKVSGSVGGGGGSAGSYTVKRGDTLTGIAGETKPPSVTLEQMLVALFKLNQDAFEGSNINRLRAGAIMTIPGPDEAAATPPGDASNVVRVQAADWRAYRDRVAGAAPASEGVGSRAAGGRIGTVVEEAAPAAPPGRDQLRVSRETAAGKGGAIAETENAIARDRQIKEQQERISELEKTIKDLQRVAELKSQALAQLQAQAEQAKGQPPKTSAPMSDAKAPEAPTATLAKPAETSNAPAPPKAAAPSTPPPAPEVKAPEAKAPEAPKAAPERPADAPKAPPKVEPAKPAPSFFDELTSNTPTWAIAIGALALLAGIAALIAARRRKTPKFDDSITRDTDIKTNTVFGSTGGGVVNTGDNSLSSDFSREGLGSIDTDEVDPIAEAEVYLAYGRDAQAEEILKDALKKDPQRQEVYLKLLEIHAQHNKPSAFETVAAELYAVAHGQGDVWQKAVALGRQLDPDNPMFAEARAGAALSDTQTFSVPPELTSEVSLAPAASPAARSEQENYDLKLDADIAQAGGPGSRLPRDTLAGAQSEFEKSTAAPAPGAFSRSAAAAATAALVDTIGKGKPLTESPPADDKIAASGFPDLEFHLDDTPAPAPAPAAPAAAHPAIDLQKLNLSFDDDRSTFEDATPSVLDGQWHDAATKLDLAKAYQEMGDVEGAREILQEVLREGDDGQKTEAQGLIAKLG